MQIVRAISDVLTALVTMLIDLVVSAFSGVVSIFYTAGTGETAGSFTIYGVFLLIGLGMFFLMLAIRFITGLIKQ